MIIYLYVKQHSITKLKYFGKTMKRDPFKYLGSGTRWLKHINKHGKNQVVTLDVWGFDDEELCSRFALEFSEKHNIVDSAEWANLRPENGIDGLPANFNGHMTPERRKQHSIRWKENNPNNLPGAREKMRARVLGDKNPTKRLEVREKLKGTKGRALPHNHYTGWDQAVKDKISKALKGHKQSDETKAKKSAAKQDLIWVNNNKDKPLQIKSHLLEQYVSQGFVRGRGPRHLW